MIRFSLSYVLIILFSIVLSGTGCSSAEKKARGGYFLLEWIEHPKKNGVSKELKPEDQTHFVHIHSYDRGAGKEAYKAAIAQIKEGDLLAFRMTAWEARKNIISGGVGKLCYRLCEYGHLAIVVKNPDDPKELRVFSSESFKGPTARETFAMLEDQRWDIFRLNMSEKINTGRLDEFVKLSINKAGKWDGYDFTGIFGLWNSNTKPSSPKKIGKEYICSTVVVAALYYAGVDLDAVKHGGIIDVVTPKQVLMSTGRIVEVPDVALEVKQVQP